MFTMDKDMNSTVCRKNIKQYSLLPEILYPD